MLRSESLGCRLRLEPEDLFRMQVPSSRQAVTLGASPSPGPPAEPGFARLTSLRLCRTIATEPGVPQVYAQGALRADREGWVAQARKPSLDATLWAVVSVPRAPAGRGMEMETAQSSSSRLAPFHLPQHPDEHRQEASDPPRSRSAARRRCGVLSPSRGHHLRRLRTRTRTRTRTTRPPR